MSKITITIAGPQGTGKTTIAAAIREMLQESDFRVRFVEEDGEVEEVDKAIERLYDFRPKPEVEVTTKVVAL